MEIFTIMFTAKSYAKMYWYLLELFSTCVEWFYRAFIAVVKTLYILVINNLIIKALYFEHPAYTYAFIMLDTVL